MSKFRLLSISLFSIIILLLSYLTIVLAWKAIPANQATYALRAKGVLTKKKKKAQLSDELLVRDRLNHIYKFGWCSKDSIQRQFFRKSVNVTLPTWQSTQGNYLYILDKRNTQRFALQCIVMKAYVPQKYQFLKSRLPVYYCQGIVWVLMLNTINKYEIHEFFFSDRINMPVNFNFEFYHPQLL